MPRSKDRTRDHVFWNRENEIEICLVAFLLMIRISSDVLVPLRVLMRRIIPQSIMQREENALVESEKMSNTNV